MSAKLRKLTDLKPGEVGYVHVSSKAAYPFDRLKEAEMRRCGFTQVELMIDGHTWVVPRQSASEVAVARTLEEAKNWDWTWE